MLSYLNVNPSALGRIDITVARDTDNNSGFSYIGILDIVTHAPVPEPGFLSAILPLCGMLIRRKR